MVLNKIQERYIPRGDSFYRNHYHHLIIALMGTIVFLMIITGVAFYQVKTRPLPQFNAMQADGNRMLLIPHDEPNLLASTILEWASKAATVSYTFDFVNANKEILAARSYYTEDGWQDYLNSVAGVISTIVQNQLFVNGVVSGTPVIANQGPLQDKDYVWRIQIPFLVTYQSANITTKRNFYVIISIVRVPTNLNPQGIGIDQFVMR
jgi:intracellular multiplication protein IcmL